MKKQAKKIHHSKPHGDGVPYAKRQQATRQVLVQAGQDTGMQYMADMIALVLNDPEIMGKDTFGKERLRRVMEGLNRYCEECWGALDGENPEAGYYQEKLGRRLKQIWGEEEFEPFEKRYNWVKDVV